MGALVEGFRSLGEEAVAAAMVGVVRGRRDENGSNSTTITIKQRERQSQRGGGERDWGQREDERSGK